MGWYFFYCCMMTVLGRTGIGCVALIVVVVVVAVVVAVGVVVTL